MWYKLKSPSSIMHTGHTYQKVQQRYGSVDINKISRARGAFIFHMDALNLDSKHKDEGWQHQLVAVTRALSNFFYIYSCSNIHYLEGILDKF